jgi:hypothetical protein
MDETARRHRGSDGMVENCEFEVARHDVSDHSIEKK